MVYFLIKLFLKFCEISNMYKFFIHIFGCHSVLSKPHDLGCCHESTYSQELIPVLLSI